MTNEEVEEKAVKLYQYRHKSKSWGIVGYKCPYCYKHYATMRKEFYSHVKECTGPTLKRSLDED